MGGGVGGGVGGRVQRARVRASVWAEAVRGGVQLGLGGDGVGRQEGGGTRGGAAAHDGQLAGQGLQRADLLAQPQGALLGLLCVGRWV